jgi:hypothetical protein
LKITFKIAHGHDRLSLQSRLESHHLVGDPAGQLLGQGRRPGVSGRYWLWRLRAADPRAHRVSRQRLAWTVGLSDAALTRLLRTKSVFDDAMLRDVEA